jgi:TolB-like protein
MKYLSKGKYILISFILSLIHCIPFSQAAELEQITLAVSSFKNLMNKPDLDWMEEGFAETITTKLNHINRLNLVERVQFNEIIDEMKLEMAGITEENASNVGKMLRADYLIIGSFQKLDLVSGSILKINARLVSVKTGGIEQGMAVSEEGPYKSIFKIQETLAAKISRHLGIGLSDSEIKHMEINETTSVTAYELYNQAKNETDDLRKEMLLEKALQYDPSYAKAHLLLGSYYGVKSMTSASFDNSSLLHLKTAIELDSNLFEAHYAIGDFYYRKSLTYRSQQDEREEETTKKALFHLNAFIENKKDSKARYYTWKVKKAQKKIKKLHF